jgi:hypothetical protein
MLNFGTGGLQKNVAKKFVKNRISKLYTNMNFYKKAILGVITALIIHAIPACKEGVTDYDREKVRLDSLNAIITNTKLALNINEAELQNRMTAIDGWYVKLYDTGNDIANKMRIDFNGFKAIYKTYIDNFFVYATALDVYDKQYKQLEKKVKDQSITRSEFKTEYAALKADVESNYQKAKLIASPVYELELSWRRYEQTMTGKAPK